MGREQFPSGVNRLIWTEVLFIQEVSGVYTFGFRYSFAGRLTNDREETGMEINNSRYDSQTYTCVPCVCFEAALEQSGDVFVLFVEQVHHLHNALKSILLLCV